VEALRYSALEKLQGVLEYHEYLKNSLKKLDEDDEEEESGSEAAVKEDKVKTLDDYALYVQKRREDVEIVLRNVSVFVEWFNETLEKQRNLTLIDDPVLRSDEVRNRVKELEKNMTKVLKPLLYEKYKKEDKKKKGEEKKKRSSEREKDSKDKKNSDKGKDRKDDDKGKDKKGDSSSDENDLSNIPNSNTDNVDL
jgi:hypothetical protein